MKKTIISAWVLLAAVFMGCMGPTDPGETLTGITRRPLPEEFSTRKAIAYSGYRTGQSPGTGVYPTESQILQDLRLLKDREFRLIRLYDSSTHGQRVLKVLSENPDLDIKVMLGVWISGPKATSHTLNLAEVSRGITLAETYKDIVLAVSVGNETLVDWSGYRTPPADLVEYIRQVRDQVTQPVTTNDNWEPFSLKNEADGAPYDTAQVAREVDFLAIHTYPYADTPWNLWDWRQTGVPEGSERAVAMMDAALARAKSNIRAVRKALSDLGLNLPLVIGETGWKSLGDKGRAHPVNQKMFYDRIMGWTYGTEKDGESPLACFYFEAFNEPWKQGDDNWGLWNVDRTEKFVLSGKDYTPDQAVYYIAPPPTTPVTENTYVLFADTEYSPSKIQSDWEWNAWENNQTAKGEYVEAGDSPDGGGMISITPTPMDWGWGMAVMNEVPEDLSNFTSGHLRFRIKTAYAGKLEVGFLTGVAADSTATDVYLTVDPAANTYGLTNTGEWVEVKIPVASIMEKAAPAYGQPATAELNMAQVTNAFVIGDRYATTKNTGSPTQVIHLDGIRWTRD